MQPFVAVLLAAAVLVAAGFGLMYACAPLIQSVQKLLDAAYNKVSGTAPAASSSETGMSLIVFGLGVCCASLPLIALTTAAGAA